MVEVRFTNSKLFSFRKSESLFFSLHSGQILSFRVVSKGTSVLVKENKHFSSSISLALLHGDRCG